MGGYVRDQPGRRVVDEIISTGASVGSGITGVTSKYLGTRWSTWAGPFTPASSSNSVLTATASSSTAITVSSGITNPDFPRAIRVAPSTSQLATTSVIVNGTNQFGTTVQDTIALGGTGAPVNGLIAFRTITSIVLPASTSTAQGAPTFTVGLSNVFGLDRDIGTVAAVIRGAVNGTAETTAPTVNHTYNTASFSTAASSSATASLELVYLHADVSHS